MTLLNFVFIVGFALLDTEHLCRTRFASDRIRSTRKNRSAGSFLGHVLHGALNKVDILFLQRNHINRILRHNLFFAGL